MTDFLCKKMNGEPFYDSAVKEEKAAKWDSIKDGMTVNLPIIVPKRGKSHAQCKLLFGNMISNAVKQAKEKHITSERFIRIGLEWAKKNIPNGIPLDKGFLHQFMYIVSPTFTDDGEQITLSKMDTEQAHRLFKVMQIFLASPGLEIIIEDPPEGTVV